MNARGKGSNCLTARGAAADIEAFSATQYLRPCLQLSMVTDIIICSSGFDSVHDFLWLLHSICTSVAIALSDVDHIVYVRQWLLLSMMWTLMPPFD